MVSLKLHTDICYWKTLKFFLIFVLCNFAVSSSFAQLYSFEAKQYTIKENKEKLWNIFLKEEKIIMIKKYSNVDTDKLIKSLNDIFELNCEEFNKKYGTDIIEKDYEDIVDFSVVKISKTNLQLEYAEIELNNFTVTIFSEGGIEKVYNDKGYLKQGRRTMKEIRISSFQKTIIRR